MRLIYLFARTAENRWDVLDQTVEPGPDEAFVQRMQENENLAAVPWMMVICLEPGAIDLSELFIYWGMAPGSDPLTDDHMHAFVRLAKEKSPPGGDGWITSPSGTAVLAENRLETVEWPKPNTATRYHRGIASCDRDANPYDPPASIQTTSATRWRIAPTIFFAVLGTIFLTVGIVTICLYVRMLVIASPEVRQDIFADTSRHIGASVLAVSMLISGVCWLIASRLYWSQRFQWAMISTVVGAVGLAIAMNAPAIK